MDENLLISSVHVYPRLIYLELGVKIIIDIDDFDVDKGDWVF